MSIKDKKINSFFADLASSPSCGPGVCTSAWLWLSSQRSNSGAICDGSDTPLASEADM